MLEAKVLVISLVLSNFAPLQTRGVRQQQLAPKVPGQPQSPKRERNWNGKKINGSQVESSSYPGRGRGHPGKSSITEVRVFEPTRGRRK